MSNIRKTCDICSSFFIHSYTSPIFCPICKQEYEWNTEHQLAMIVLSEAQKELLRAHYGDLVRTQYEAGKKDFQVLESS